MGRCGDGKTWEELEQIPNVHACSWPIFIESSDEGIEFFGGRTDSHKEGDFHEDKDHSGDPSNVSKRVQNGLEKARDTDRQMMEKIMSRDAWNIFAIPSAMQTKVNI